MSSRACVFVDVCVRVGLCMCVSVHALVGALVRACVGALVRACHSDTRYLFSSPVLHALVSCPTCIFFT